jgi:hypothetical protein
MTTPALPLTAFEEFLVWEDRPAYPWSIFTRLRFSGRIDRPAFESAVQAIMPRHPMLISRLEMRGRRRFWIVQPGALPEMVWAAGPTGQAFPATGRQDLSKEIGLRVFVVESHDSCDVTLQFHHACCDGAGIAVFVNDLLIAYALAKGMHSRRLQLPPLDPGRLARRGAYGLTFWKFVKLLPRQLADVRDVRQFFTRTPSPLLPHRVLPDDDPPPAGFPATRTHLFTRAQTAGLYETARRLGVTVNDLLARDVFLALGEWRARHGAGDGDAWLRMMVPIDLRSPGDRLLSAANMVGSVFLDRRSRDFADPAKLLAGIAGELQDIKDNRLGLTFIYALRALGLLPDGLKNNARRDRCSVSSIFSNMGKVLRRCPLPKDNGRHVAGDAILEQIEGVAPIRPYNCVTFLANEYVGRLTMTLHYDPRPVGAAQADDLTATFARRVQATVNGSR